MRIRIAENAVPHRDIRLRGKVFHQASNNMRRNGTVQKKINEFTVDDGLFNDFIFCFDVSRLVAMDGDPVSGRENRIGGRLAQLRVFQCDMAAIHRFQKIELTVDVDRVVDHPFENAICEMEISRTGERMHGIRLIGDNPLRFMVIHETDFIQIDVVRMDWQDAHARPVDDTDVLQPDVAAFIDEKRGIVPPFMTDGDDAADFETIMHGAMKPYDTIIQILRDILMDRERKRRIAMDGLADHAQRRANAVMCLRIKALHEHVDAVQLQILPIFAGGNQLAVFNAAWMMRVELDVDISVAARHDRRLRKGRAVMDDRHIPNRHAVASLHDKRLLLPMQHQRRAIEIKRDIPFVLQQNSRLHHAAILAEFHVIQHAIIRPHMIDLLFANILRIVFPIVRNQQLLLHIQYPLMFSINKIRCFPPNTFPIQVQYNPPFPSAYFSAGQKYGLSAERRRIHLLKIFKYVLYLPSCVEHFLTVR